MSIPPGVRLVVFVVAAATVVVTQTLVVRDVVSGRAPGSRDGSRLGEIVWAALPALGLIAVLVVTWRAMSAAPGS